MARLYWWVTRVLWCLWQVKGSYRFVIKGPSEEGVWFLDLKGQQGTITYGDKVQSMSSPWFVTSR
jgi:hypothetical protein